MSSLGRGILLGAGGLLLAGSAALVHWYRQVQAPAQGDPAAFPGRGTHPDRRVVVCLGASIVHGRVSVDFVELLRRRHPAEAYAFVNAGVNGDLVYNALQRADSVLACDPDFVVILVGTNDVQCTISERIKQLSARGKQLPQEPSLEWYRESLAELLRRLHAGSQARVGVCSLPVLGEDLDALANRRIAEFNEVIREVTAATAAAYLPVYERQVSYLVKVGRTRGLPYTDSPIPVMAASMQHFLLGWSFDAISQRNGLALTTDRIHMNSLGASMIVEEVERFLARP